MRYLKATAQDLCGNGHADTVILHFYQQQPDGPDELIHETVGLDMTVDGKVDVQLAGSVGLVRRNWINTYLRASPTAS